MSINVLSTVHSKGTTTEAYITKLCYHDKQVKAVYNCLTGDLIILKWYNFDNGDLAELRNELTAYFKQLIAARKGLTSLRAMIENG